MSPSDVQVLVAASSELVIRARGDRWTHLSLCVLDAVYSINARYGSVVRVCHRYADHAGLADRLLPAADIGQVVGTRREESVAAFADSGRGVGPDRLAGEVLGNRGRTSTRGGILKAEAAIRYAEILAAAGVQRLGDVAGLLANPGVLWATVAAALGHQVADEHLAGPLDGEADTPEPQPRVVISTGIARMRQG